jgi:hypothetical protein
MKILKERKPFEEWKRIVNCTGGDWNQGDKVPCGSTLQIDSNDLIKRKWFKYPDYEGVSYGFICPVCGCFTNLNENELPDHLKIIAKDYKTMK